MFSHTISVFFSFYSIGSIETKNDESCPNNYKCNFLPVPRGESRQPTPAYCTFVERLYILIIIIIIYFSTTRFKMDTNKEVSCADFKNRGKEVSKTLLMLYIIFFNYNYNYMFTDLKHF